LTSCGGTTDFTIPERDGKIARQKLNTSNFQCLLDEVVLSNFTVQERDGQTDKNSTFLIPPEVCNV